MINSKLIKILAFAFLFYTQASPALPTVKCYAWLLGPEDKELRRVDLQQASYDPEWYEADISHYGFGADMWYLKDEGVGLIIYNNKSKRFASSTAGFRRIGETKHYEASLDFSDEWPDGRTVKARVQCNYTRPN